MERTHKRYQGQLITDSRFNGGDMEGDLDNLITNLRAVVENAGLVFQIVRHPYKVTFKGECMQYRATYILSGCASENEFYKLVNSIQPRHLKRL